MPEYVIARKPFALTFVVWGAGTEPMYVEGLPKVTANSGAISVEGSVSKAKNPGEYTATLILPRPGLWMIRIQIWTDETGPDRFNGSTLPELRSIDAGTGAPPQLHQAALGERLFVLKGCNTCHSIPEEKLARARESNPTIANGPYLFERHTPEAYWKRFLAGPVEPVKVGDIELHKLGLTRSEVEALKVFLANRKL